MSKGRRWAYGAIVAALVFGAALAGCTTTVTTGAFPDVNRIERDLKRGVSTKIDVRRVLGAPSGSGGSLFPTITGLHEGRRQVWFYDDVEATGTTQQGDFIQLDVRQQILLVFFEREKFDGFMWFTNVEHSE